jgi:hypothetical protein
MKRTASPWTPAQQRELRDLAEQIVRIRTAEAEPPTVQSVEKAMTNLLQIALEWERAHAASPNAKRATAARSAPPPGFHAKPKRKATKASAAPAARRASPKRRARVKSSR